MTTSVSTRKVQISKNRDDRKTIRMVERPSPKEIRLENHPLRHHMRTGFVTFTPEMALQILDEWNNVNRDMSSKRIDQFYEIFEEGNWLVNDCHYISFFEDGNLATGQHRLAIAVITGEDVRIKVIWGVTEEDREAADRESHSAIDKVQMKWLGSTKEQAKCFLEISKFRGIEGLEGYSLNSQAHSLAALQRQVSTTFKYDTVANPQWAKDAITNYPKDVEGKEVIVKPKKLRDKSNADLVLAYRKSLLIYGAKVADEFNKGGLFASTINGIFNGRELDSVLERSTRTYLERCGRSTARKAVVTTQVAMVIGAFLNKFLRNAWSEELSL